MTQHFGDPDGDYGTARPVEPLRARQTTTTCGGETADHADAVLTIEIRAVDREDLPGLLSEVRKVVKRGKLGGDLQFCAGACRYKVTLANEEPS